MTVYFVDEDYPKFQAWLAELEYRGLNVIAVGDADRAYSILTTADDVEWVVIDVMLAASEQPGSQFDAARTDGSLETGLVLLRDLARARPEIFPARAQLLTNTTNAQTFDAAKRCALEFSVQLLEKTQVENAREFGDLVSDALSQLEWRS